MTKLPTFTRQEVYNWQNNHLGATENAHLSRKHYFQTEFYIDLLPSIIRNYKIGRPPRLNSVEYLHFHMEEDISLNLLLVYAEVENVLVTNAVRY